jgi:hypothetical protein
VIGESRGREIFAYFGYPTAQPRDSTLPALLDGFEQLVLTELDLVATGIADVIWATSYEFDFSLAADFRYRRISHPDARRDGISRPFLCRTPVAAQCKIGPDLRCG